ncbi:helix-turn-helix domain-containing protein [Aureibacter tunicatorum]|uniref:Transcriptional antiterminator n=1 Tax=Aureibacter tunicatorum TaxID=866807 RepID=A0AAE3XS42_9BACT|nr:helix-turn-helix domain-containing protein [Aureibacter tunicatorum]MDR6240960.1 transcriptional antiterminator [Aureibacter tunicatorum]BDD03740.1 hypothetical protein AUTU_12230 [Aureibacter tunicatorum]
MSQEKKFKTRKEIAHEIGVSPKTLYRYLKKLELNFPQGRLNPKQVIQIYEALGVV